MKIVMSGCFDTFHSGHRSILWKAIDFAGKDGQIVVFMNTDESIKKLKGEDRPRDNFEIRKKKVEKFISKSGAKMHLVHFDNEFELLFGYKVVQPDAILHGDDIFDVREVTGYGLYPILLIPRIKNKNGEELSTTAILKAKEEME